MDRMNRIKCYEMKNNMQIILKIGTQVNPVRKFIYKINGKNSLEETPLPVLSNGVNADIQDSKIRRIKIKKNLQSSNLESFNYL